MSAADSLLPNSKTVQALRDAGRGKTEEADSLLPNSKTAQALRDAGRGKTEEAYSFFSNSKTAQVLRDAGLEQSGIDSLRQQALYPRRQAPPQMEMVVEETGALDDKYRPLMALKDKIKSIDVVILSGSNLATHEVKDELMTMFNAVVEVFAPEMSNIKYGGYRKKRSTRRKSTKRKSTKKRKKTKRRRR